MSQHHTLLKEFENFAATSSSPEALMQHICGKLHQEMTRYNWIAFLLVDVDEPTTLVLNAHAGSLESPHVRIPFSLGLCGAAASTGKTIVVDDLDLDLRVLRDSD